MDKAKIFSALSLSADSLIHLRGMELTAWGRDLQFECQANDSVSFNMIFSDCREIHWQLYSHKQDLDAFPVTQVVNFRLGQGQHRKPTHLLTEHFGLRLVYGRLLLKTDDTQIELDR